MHLQRALLRQGISHKKSDDVPELCLKLTCVASTMDCLGIASTSATKTGTDMPDSVDGSCILPCMLIFMCLKICIHMCVCVCV